MFLILTHLIIVQLSQPTCELQPSMERHFDLKIDGKVATIETLGPDPKILRCQKVEGFSNMFAVEVDMGTTGTSSESHETDLMIFESSDAGLRKLLHNPIEVVNIRRNQDTGEIEKFGEKKSYTIEKGSSGEPAIKLKDAN